MSNALFQAAYLKSKLKKHSGNSDPLIQNLNNLIESLITEAKSGQRVHVSGGIETVKEVDEDSSLDITTRERKPSNTSSTNLQNKTIEGSRV